MVIARRNRGLRSAFIVRKISSGEGVERTFQTYSPLIAGIEVKRKGEVRRSKLYYLRERSGRARASVKSSVSVLMRPKPKRRPRSNRPRTGMQKGPAGPFSFYNPVMKRESAALSPVTEIIAEIRAGNIVVLVDDEDRENEGDLFFAADFVTPEKVNFLATHGRGLICMPIPQAHAARLGLKPMVSENRSRHGTNFTNSIEAAEGIATGISAHDRALTIRVASAASATAADIVQPGHVFPLIAQDGGVLVRAGHTEACCDLARLAGLTPAAVLCEIMREDGTMARLPDLMEFAAEHKLKIGTIADLIEYRSRNESDGEAQF